jgi:hypothetical protein
MNKLKIRRYILKAKPERTVVLLPVRGQRTLLKDMLKVVKQESIPSNAGINVLLNADGTGRRVRFEWIEKAIAA